jgi:glycosyltransferase involved in cell wall biosynthesis
MGRLLGTAGGRTVVVGSPYQYVYLDPLRGERAIYFAVDDMTLTVDGNPIPGERELEQKLLTKVDRVVCASAVTAERIQSRRPGSSGCPVSVLANGYGADRFKPVGIGEAPRLLSGIPRPRILCSGLVSRRIEWDVIRQVARVRREWNWVFAGPMEPGFEQPLRESVLEDVANVHLVGSVPFREMPALVRACDVCVIPYRLNAFTRASCPLKAMEYLAMGSPVVSTRIPALETYDAVIEWVEDGSPESYERALEKALANGEVGQEAMRREAVKDASWASRAASFVRDLAGG